MKPEDKGMIMFLLAILFVILASIAVIIIPAIVLAAIILKLFPELSLTLTQLTAIFVIVGVLLRTKVTISNK